MAEPYWNPRTPTGRVVDPHATPSERTYATFQHLTLVLLHFIPVIPALVMWRLRAQESPFLDDHGKEAVNFQISLVIYFVVAAVLAVIVVGFLLMAVVWVLGIVGCIMGAVAANRGEYFRYPMSLRLIA
ncbi:MAG: DUF4870 domain-containing protein [Phycisphaerales bacterium]